MAKLLPVASLHSGPASLLGTSGNGIHSAMSTHGGVVVIVVVWVRIKIESTARKAEYQNLNWWKVEPD
jgi:hypothetical protein